MAAQVFTDADVGEYFNSNFIHVKMDMEETEGMLVGRRYSVISNLSYSSLSLHGS
jgi:uncharacterized protein YyaL (SSP411 family)